MPTTPSPLRYPGGKTKVYPYVRELIMLNGLNGQTYIEPFAGGAGLALKLLFNNDVKRLVMNDLDPAIYAFWFSVLNNTIEMCDYIENVNLTMDEWEHSKYISLNTDKYDMLEIAKSTIFLNRTNISGVITGGVIGGKDQKGKYKLDARFSRSALISKIKRVAEYREVIDLYNLDTIDFLRPDIMSHYYKVFINFDPPYVEKGGKLYKNAFTCEDHRNLKNAIKHCSRKWIVTYDVCPLIRDIYNDFRGSYLDVYYSVNQIRKAKEYIFFSDNLLLPKTLELLERKDDRAIKNYQYSAMEEMKIII